MYKKRLSDNKGNEELLNMLFDAIFVMGLKNYKPLEKKIDEVLSQKVWPSTEQLISEWSTFLTIRKSIVLEREKSEGMLEANRANVAHTRQGGGQLKANAGYTRGDKLPHYEDKICFKCGKKGNT